MTTGTRVSARWPGPSTERYIMKDEILLSMLGKELREFEDASRRERGDIRKAVIGASDDPIHKMLAEELMDDLEHKRFSLRGALDNLKPRDIAELTGRVYLAKAVYSIRNHHVPALCQNVLVLGTGQAKVTPSESITVQGAVESMIGAASMVGEDRWYPLIASAILITDADVRFGGEHGARFDGTFNTYYAWEDEGGVVVRKLTRDVKADEDDSYPVTGGLEFDPEPDDRVSKAMRLMFRVNEFSKALPR